MTRVNKIVCHGFKSFAKFTEMEFTDKFNCILGPNGSGKSNVLDAICFVLGKSSTKSLRAEKASNLIYNGGKLKQPAKFGEVSIYFDNTNKTFPTPEKEVKISRIVQSSGQSKYKINDQTRTRQQIIDLLGMGRIDPDGYNIILQGDIIHFVEMPPTERRELIDEISGISAYEEKKHKAELELNKVDERLKEADIILTERNSYLKELKKDRDQAIKYKEVADNIKVSKGSYVKVRIDKRDKIKEKFEANVSEFKEKLDKLNGKINALKDENNKKKQEIEDLAKEVEEKGHGNQEGVTKQIEHLKIEITKNSGRIDSLKNEINKIEQRKQELDSNRDDLKEKIKGLEERKKEIDDRRKAEEADKKEVEQKIAKFKEKHKLDSANDIELDIEKMDKDIEEKEKGMMQLRESQQNLLREKDRIEYQLNTIDERLKKVAEIEKEHKQQMDELKDKRDLFKKYTLDLNKRLNEDSEHAARIAEKRRLLMKNVEELAKLEAKNISIKETASVNTALKKINELKTKNGVQGVYGTISELGNVSSKYATALEVAAGNKINSIVVENDAVAAQCIKYLKQNKFGIATFIPLNKIKGRDIDEEAKKLGKTKGASGFALDLIEYDPKFRKAFSYVFENTLVVDNIDTVRKIGVGNCKMVTLDGDVSEVSGAMQGGFRQRGKGPGFQEKDLTEGIRKLEEGIEEIKMDVKAIEERRIENESSINQLRQNKGEIEGEIIKMEKVLHLNDDDIGVDRKQKDSLKDEQKMVDTKLSEIMNKISSQNRELAQVKINKQALKAKISQLRSPTLIAELNTFDQKRTELNEILIHLNNDIKNIENEVNNIHKPEFEKIDKIVKQHGKEKEEFHEEIKKKEAEVKEMNKQLKEKEEAAAKFYKKFKELFSKRGKINEDISKNETVINEKQDEARSVEIKMNGVSLELARVNAELAGLNEEFEQYRGVALKLDKSEDEYKAEVARSERVIANIGNVNMRALEIYEQVEAEFNKLTDKKNTLESEKGDVLNLINEIEGRKKEIFVNTMEMVNKNFQEIFSQISTKGEANLELENPENPFEGGLNIRVKIATNKFLDIKSLSGGEKTMTALAFIFAIQEHNPSSFYVLDEVDAALDKRNAEKLGHLIKKYCERAQYIVISHNDQLISMADNLYGVSMNEHGVSKVVSLKI